MRRKLVATLAATALVSGLVTACSSEQTHGDKPLVLTTFTILADMAQQVAGDAVDVRSITAPGAEIHGYDPTPSDMAAASDADLVLSNGLGLEHWLDKLLTHSTANRVVATDGIEPISIENTNTPNPHAWMSPALAKVYVDNIINALARLQPESAETFRSNGDHYKQQLEEVDRQLNEGLSSLPQNKRTLVTCEGAFSYLTREAHMHEGYIWPVNSNKEITPSQIRNAAAFTTHHQVPAVFCESTVEPGPHEQLMRETGAADGGTLYVDSLSAPDGPVPTFLDLISYDVNTIVDGLKK